MNALAVLAPLAGVRFPGFLAVVFAGARCRPKILDALESLLPSRGQSPEKTSEA